MIVCTGSGKLLRADAVSPSDYDFLTCVNNNRCTPAKATDFNDDEFVVYTSNQQYISYLVEFVFKNGMTNATVTAMLDIVSFSIFLFVLISAFCYRNLHK